MTPELLKAKAIIARHYSNVKAENRKPKRNDYLLSGEKHLFNFLKNNDNGKIKNRG